ncbi:MAG: nitroreductase family protein, partial [Terracidiphilus sp.]
MTLSASEVNKIKQAHRAEGVLPIIHQRWSARAFADRDVAAADLKRVFEAARWAASSNNEQPWRFVVGRRGTATHEKIFATLMGFN